MKSFLERLLSAPLGGVALEVPVVVDPVSPIADVNEDVGELGPSPIGQKVDNVADNVAPVVDVDIDIHEFYVDLP